MALSPSSSLTTPYYYFQMNSLTTYPSFIFIVITCFSALNCTNKPDQTDFQPTGAITGCVYELGTPNAIEGAIILIDGSDEPWSEVATANTGQFLMLSVPPGVYSVRVSALKFHKQTVQRVRVAPDSISIVAIRLTNTELDVTPDTRSGGQNLKRPWSNSERSPSQARCLSPVASNCRLV